jgi:hypothetical protein
MKNKVMDSITIFATGMSAVDWAWKLLTIFIIGGSGTATGILAADSPFFRELGFVAWIAIGLICSISIALVFYLIRSAENQTAQTEYTRAVSQPKQHVNPLLDSFKDQIIPVEELRVPGVQVHENKHFKRCKFVGPAAIALIGGSFIRTSFNETGDIIPIPDNTLLTGIIVLKNCTVEDCSFFRTTIMTNKDQAKAMVAAINGMKVAGT